jgi:hypothetical protein
LAYACMGVAVHWRRHRGMIQINEVLGNWKLFPVTAS